MDTLVEQFREELQRQDSSPVTVRNYVNDVELFLRWLAETYGESITPKKVIERDVIEYRGFLVTVQIASPATINRRLASLGKFFSWLVSVGQTKKSPTVGVKGIAVVDAGPKALDATSLRRLLREVHLHENARDIAVLESLCGTAIRVGELVSLTLDDVTISERKGSLRIRNGKGRSSREIPLNVDVRKALQGWLTVRPATSSKHLIIGQRGEKMTPSGIWRIVKRYAALAGIPEMSMHSLRHTVLTRLVRELNCDLVTVAKISGHRNLKTLMRYTEPTRENLESAMEKLALTS